MRTLPELLHFLQEHVEAVFKPEGSNFTVHSHQYGSPVAKVTPDVIKALEKDGIVERHFGGNYQVRHGRAQEAHRRITQNSHSDDFTGMAVSAGLGALAGFGLASMFDSDDSSSRHSSSFGGDFTPSPSFGGGDFSGGGSSESSSSGGGDWGSSDSSSSSCDSGGGDCGGGGD